MSDAPPPTPAVWHDVSVEAHQCNNLGIAITVRVDRYCGNRWVMDCDLFPKTLFTLSSTTAHAAKQEAMALLRVQLLAMATKLGANHERG